MPENNPTDLLDLASLGGFASDLCLKWPRSQILEHGENAHQKAALYGDVADYFKPISGPFPAFTAIQDLVAGMFLMGEFEKAAIAVLKSGHILGCMVAMSIEEAWAQWPKSAMTPGAVVVLNRTVDDSFLKLLVRGGAQGLLAPGYTPDAVKWAAQEAPKISLVQMAQLLRAESLLDIRLLPFGALVQDRERFSVNLSAFRLEPGVDIPSSILEDALFAWRCVKHARSCAGAMAHKETTLAISTGQLSAQDAWLLAYGRAKESTMDFKGVVFATDTPSVDPAFIKQAAKTGLSALLAPVNNPEEGQSLRKLASDYGLWFIEARKAHFRL